MKIGTKILILFLTLNLFSCKGTAQERDTKGPTAEFDFSTVDKFRESKRIGQIVNDYDNIFSFSQQKELSNIIYAYNIATTRQIVVVTIDSINPYSDIQKMASDLGNYWGVGAAEKDNGLIILLCKPCRKIGIVTGYETELVLTDEICQEIIDKTIIPEFRNENFYAGIKNGLVELIAKWK